MSLIRVDPHPLCRVCRVASAKCASMQRCMGYAMHRAGGWAGLQEEACRAGQGVMHTSSGRVRLREEAVAAGRDIVRRHDMHYWTKAIIGMSSLTCHFIGPAGRAMRRQPCKSSCAMRERCGMHAQKCGRHICLLHPASRTRQPSNPQPADNRSL